MCFQGFVYFACGHNRIVAHDCKLALMSGNPYYIKHQCPDYNSSSERPNFQCGVGRYYCSESVDGPFLDHVHQAAATAQSNIGYMDAELAKVYTGRQQVIAQAALHGMSNEVRNQTKEWKHLLEHHQWLKTERNTQQRIHIDATAIILQAHQFYKNMRSHFTNFDNVVSRPAFVPGQTVFGNLPVQPATQTRTVCLGSLSNQPGMHVQQTNSAMRPLPQLPSSARSNLAVTPRHGTAHQSAVHGPRRGDTISALANNVRLAQQAEQVRQRNLHPTANQERSAGQSRRSTAPRAQRSKAAESGADGDDSAGEEVEVVRRSARVRNKKVNYAEDGGSSVASREPSPAKSDISAFSPLKSDASSLAEKDGSDKLKNARKQSETPQTMRRPASSLNDKIADWSKRSTARETSTVNRRTMPDMKDILNSSPGPEASASTRIVTQAKDQSPPQYDTFEEEANKFKKPGAPYRGPVSTPQSLGMQQTSITPNLVAKLGSVGSIALVPTPVTSTIYHAAHQNEGHVPLFRPQQPLSGENANDLAYSGVSWDQHSPSPYAHLQQELPAPHSYQALNVRTDSITGHGEEEHSEHETDRESYYGGLRRSFGSGTPLPPTKPANLTQSDTEPRKRLSSTFVETPEPRKRMRLSLPGEETQDFTPPAPNWLLGQGLTMNTDEGEAPYVSATTHEHMSMQGSNTATTLSAPFDPPTATMIAVTPAPVMGALDGITNSPMGTGQTAEQGPAEIGTAESEAGFSDIDWGHHDHDLESSFD